MSELWSQIIPPSESGKVALRRADATYPFDFFRGRDHEGRFLFALQGRFTERDHGEIPQLSGLKIGITNDHENISTLWLTLLDASQEEIFRALSSNLMTATRQVDPGNYDAAVDAVFGRIRRWQDLLKRRHDQDLTRQEQIGLFGELLLLRDVFLSRLQPRDALECWRGPEPDEQDFLFGDWMIEVKTQVSSSDSRLRIASENQLDTTSGRIALCHQRLSSSDSAEPDSRTLNGLVDEIFLDVAGASVAGDRFNSLLIESGYEPKPAYGSQHWRLSTRDFFEVRDGFPLITPAMLPLGVDRVRYEITLDSCGPFLVPHDQLFSWVFEE